MSDRKAAALAIAIALAVPAEGLRQYAYRDPVGILTVCYGTTGQEVVPGKKYSLGECKGMLTSDMRQAVETVERCIPGLPEGPLAAFADTVYNAGPTIVCKPQKSTAARYLLSGNIEGACNELPRWDKVRILGAVVALPGLTIRREKAREVCLG